MSNISHTHTIADYQEHLLAGGRARGTIHVRISHISRCLAFIDKPLWAVTTGDIERWLAAGEWGSAARKSARSSMRVFFSWAEGEGLISVNPTAGIIPVPQVRTVPRPCPDALISDAMRVADKRVRLAVEIMATCGLRRDECARVRACDVEPVGQGWVLRVQGKGGHTRVVPCPPHLARRIASAGGWVFPGGHNGHISAGWLGKLISRALPGAWTPHKIRHRYATVAYGHSYDLRAVQELLGHASVATTQIYTSVSDLSLRTTAAAAWKIAI
ncbi:tyrosine-type recombinase/integrase [Corynebacterium diphtheriae]|uniref:tyrosine-type recombinase/integrase n=1 Tax=Corynebacterium diphtheriae TaxID=1717 RepID=UPI0008FB3B46|nr:tyrosine-type recombinase/integrase [Corynebacterium diphtheriae]MDZ5308294.1 tyrosine-type recombinase/integrase [Corynebacterium diphtheriae]OIR92162.1 integrase [Corynebacterium diphtheriae]OIR96046.1 integrase [Corynebacterium diphtheriae]OIR98039.1 integrase [Corynebacterium diphtheriae]TBX16020.1 integrase [Corynebacterium diphtheriae]